MHPQKSKKVHGNLHNLVVQCGEDVGVTGVGDGEDGDTEVLTASSAQFDVVAVVVVNIGLGEHSIVLNLGSHQRRAVRRDDDELGITVSERLEGSLLADGGLARLHDERETRVDGLDLLFGNLGSHF